MYSSKNKILAVGLLGTGDRHRKQCAIWLRNLLIAYSVFASPINLASLHAPIHASSSQPTLSEKQQLNADLTETLPDPATILPEDQTVSVLRHNLWLSDIAWVSDIGTLLSGDRDHDGYYTGISLTVDADSAYQHLDVYLTIDVQANGQIRERLHSTAIFTLSKHSVIDEYQIDIELLRHYSAGHYDLFIELHDAYDNRLLDSVNAADFSNLYSLPLESNDLDDLPLVAVPPVHHSANDDIAIIEHAGAGGLFLLAILSLILTGRSGIHKRGKDQCAGRGLMATAKRAFEAYNETNVIVKKHQREESRTDVHLQT